MTEKSYRLPGICAWCGYRQSANVIEVQFHHAKTSMTMKLPICTECAEHRAWLIEVKNRISNIFWIPAISIALIGGYFTSYLMTGGEYILGWHLVVSVGYTPPAYRLALLIFMNDNFYARIRKTVVKMEHQPPFGYVSTGSTPGRMTSSQRLEFFAPRFQRRFASLNPDLVMRT